jgi:colanic acid biosynthesis glycosyl transferase WcaI
VKILIYGLNFSPELTGVGKYSGEMAVWLAQHNVRVDVVTAPPYYPSWTLGEGYKAGRYARESLPGYEEMGLVVRCPLWLPKKLSGLKRLIHLASFTLSSLPVFLWMLISRRPDMVFVVAPSMMYAAPAALLAKLLRLRSWLHIQDFEVDAAFGLNMLKSAKLRSFVLAVERATLNMFCKVSTISMRMLELLQTKGVSRAQSVLFPNWVDTSLIQPHEGANKYRDRFGIAKQQCLCLYSGNLGEKQGLEVIVEAAKVLANNPSIQFLISGEGSAKTGLQSLAQGLNNIHWLELQPLERLSELLGSADIHLLPQRDGAADLVMPSKLSGMLASGRPVIGAARAETELGMVLKEVGVRIEPADAVAMAGAIQELSEDPARRNLLGRRSRDYSEKSLGKNSILLKLLGDMKSLVYPSAN